MLQSIPRTVEHIPDRVPTSDLLLLVSEDGSAAVVRDRNEGLPRFHALVRRFLGLPWRSAIHPAECIDFMAGSVGLRGGVS